MAKTTTDTARSNSDTNFWRSQHTVQRAVGSSEIPQDKRDIVLNAVCNRFGEELGHRLDVLIWPMIPESMKRLTGVFGGRVLPLIEIFNKLRSLTSEAQEKSARKLAGSVLSDAEQAKVILDAVPGSDDTKNADTLRTAFVMRFASQLGIDLAQPINDMDNEQAQVIAMLVYVARML